MNIRTSATHPIGINWLPAQDAGLVGLTFAPGKHGSSKSGPRWERDLDADLRRLIDHHGMDVLVCLLENHELARYMIHNLIPTAEVLGIKVLRLPIPDGGVLPRPGPVAELIAAIREQTDQGKRVVVHCAGGLGRTGTIAGCYLVEFGMSADEAIETLHRVRGRNCPETRGQEEFIAMYAVAFERERP